jgi:fucose permease
MFKKLQQKWKVNNVQFALIFTTFAIGGSLTGYVTRKLFKLTSLEPGILKSVLYIVVLTIIWPFMVLLVSVFTGQLVFFKNYIKKMLSRFGFKRKA